MARMAGGHLSKLTGYREGRERTLSGTEGAGEGVAGSWEEKIESSKQKMTSN